jgi:hypothetical protein
MRMTAGIGFFKVKARRRVFAAKSLQGFPLSKCGEKADAGQQHVPLLCGIVLREAQKTLGAQGIVAEILFCGRAAKKIAAESPVFLRLCRKKMCQDDQFDKKSTCRCPEVNVLPLDAP